MLSVNNKSWKEESNLETLKNLAIEAALTSNWQEAAKINQKIILTDTQDVEALNRLARAQVCCTQINKAIKTYKKVLAIDPYNIIAKKNFEKIAKLEKSNGNNHSKIKTIGISTPKTNGESNRLSDIFLFEPGKTKVISLLNLAPPYVLASLACGDQLALSLKKHGICITTQDNIYLGALPDDFAHKLLSFIEGGNKYETYVKSATVKNLTIFIREVYRSPKFINQPSFSILNLKDDNKNLAFS